MNIRTYLEQEKITSKEMARRLNISPAYMSQIIHGIRNISIYIAFAIENETNGKIKASSLRNDIAEDITISPSMINLLRKSSLRPPSDEVS
ncbi:MAG: helix-turn-helix domain-containing protein [Nitrospirae bacterium]|nr:helix-turn-helix domain-containing protein [Nitrospirota bacterium]